MTIDVHSHFIPVGLPDMAERTGDPRWPTLIAGSTPVIVQDGRRYRTVDASYYDTETRVDCLDDLGIDVQIISPLPVMMPFWADARSGRDFCAAYNDLLAAAVAEHPHRFRAFGIVPLQEPALAVQEIARVLQLGLAGLEFGTWLSSERRLADPQCREVFAAAAEANLPVLLHPNHPDTFGCGSPELIELGVGVGCETARAMSELHIAGSLTDLPGLRLCLSHGGGAFLWLWPRFSFLAGRAGLSSELPESLCFDTAGLVHANLEYIRTVVPADRVLFGSDLPAVAIPRVRAQLAGLDDETVGRNVERFVGR